MEQSYNRHTKNGGVFNMMYETHQQVGKNFYLVSIPFMIQFGVFPNIIELIQEGASAGDIVTAGVTLVAGLYVGYKGSQFGAGFPDLDLKGSVPDKKNPLLGKIIRGCGATHRGKFSHSLDSQTIFWFIIYMLGIHGLNRLSLNDLGVISNWLAFDGFINNLLKIWVISAYVGVVSHLFADLPTGGGIRIFSFQKPIKMKWKFFRTGNDSTWERFYRKTAKILTPICAVVSVYLYIKG